MKIKSMSKTVSRRTMTSGAVGLGGFATGMMAARSPADRNGADSGSGIISSAKAASQKVSGFDDMPDDTLAAIKEREPKFLSGWQSWEGNTLI
tara:strand:- start:4566 stop:4844 length:279 start_codon:yes stop_codon:yes gene_type:complete